MNDKENRVLYFEGVGMDNPAIADDFVKNCRIRTAFHLDNKSPVYLEIVGGRLGKIEPALYTASVVCCYRISTDEPNDDCNRYPITKYHGTSFVYSEEEVLKVVNGLGASFDAIKVLPPLGGYRAFKEHKPYSGPAGYRFGDEFEFDPEMLTRREAVYDKVYGIESDQLLADKAMNGDKFVHSPSGVDRPNFSLWVDENDPGLLHLLRHFNGYNKHWEIRTDEGDTLEEWMATAKVTRLGRSGC